MNMNQLYPRFVILLAKKPSEGNASPFPRYRTRGLNSRKSPPLSTRGFEPRENGNFTGNNDGV